VGCGGRKQRGKAEGSGAVGAEEGKVEEGEGVRCGRLAFVGPAGSKWRRET